MTTVEQEDALEAAIKTALHAVAYDPPIGVQYCTAVRDALRPLLPTAVLECYHSTTHLIVEAREGRVVKTIELKLPTA